MGLLKRQIPGRDAAEDDCLPVHLSTRPPVPPLVRSRQLLLPLLRVLLDDFLRDLVRGFLVALEAALEARTALRHRLNRARIPVQLCLRHDRANARAQALDDIRAEDVAAA